MKRKVNYLEDKRSYLLSDYRHAKNDDKVKILVEIMDLEEELSYAALPQKRQAF